MVNCIVVFVSELKNLRDFI